MKKFLKKYGHLTALLAVLVMAFAFFQLGAPLSTCMVFVGLWQLSQFAMSKRRCSCFMATFTPEQVDEMDDILKGIRAEMPKVKIVSDRLNQIEKINDDLRSQINRMKKTGLNGLAGTQTGLRWVGGVPFVTDDFANFLSAKFVVDCSKIKGALETMKPDESARERILSYACGIIGVEQRAALTTTEIPVPTIYVPQIVELVFAYGQARKFATVFPLGAGSVKLPRLKAGEDDFGYIGVGTAGMSQPVTERKVAAELVTFTANKAGGLIRIPTELEEDTFIPIGQFLARYIARQLAKLEDKTLFLGDGTATYANITGIGPYCSSNATYLQQLAAGKTKPTDATINDFRAIRGKVNPAVLFGMAANGQASAAYYMSPSMDALLCTFNTLNQPLIYRPQNGNQPATLDGFPIHWIGVSQPYGTTAAPSAFLAFFGDLSYWYLGERGAPRVEVSRDVFFATDELAMRALERIDVEMMAIDAMSALETAAA